uniref:OPA3-like protein CG13603 n=1 Tax=Panstrongylus megistus TaxID=65343 RepID=A0A069DQ88_9HEMI
MVVAAFPAAKLGTLLIRQVSKPIATYVKERAKKHPFFRKYICMPPAQFYNWCEVKMKMWIFNLGKPTEIPNLNETMAIELGANLLGESIIFTIAAAILFLEYSRQVRKEAAKEEARKAEISTISYTIQELYFQAERQDAQIRELMRSVGDLQTKIDNLRRPFGPIPPHIPSDSDNSSSGPSKDPLLEPTLQMKRYNGGIVFSALDYVTYQIPNGFHDRR